MKGCVHTALVKSLLAILIFSVAVASFAQQEPILQHPPDNASPPGNTAPADQTVPRVAPSPPAAAGESAGTVSDFSLVRAAGGLGLVVALIIAGFFLVRKLAPQYLTRQASGRCLELIDTLSLGDRRSIALLQVQDQRFLVGNTAQQITLLASLPGALSLVAGPQPVVPSRSEMRPSADSLRNLYDTEKKRPLHEKPKAFPPDVRAKIRQLQEVIER